MIESCENESGSYGAETGSII